jgi:CBS-domain-containing membrane protein
MSAMHRELQFRKTKTKFFSIRVSSFESFFLIKTFSHFVVNVSERETKDDSTTQLCKHQFKTLEVSSSHSLLSCIKIIPEKS